MPSAEENLRWNEVNRRRRRFFGDESLKVYTTTPEDGDAVAETFTIDWFGHRVQPTTTGEQTESGAWQFQIRATGDWETTQAFMNKISSLTIGDKRWKASKVEKPMGTSLAWKVKGKLQ